MLLPLLLPSSTQCTDILKGFINGEKTLAEYSEKELLELADWCFSTKDDNVKISTYFITYGVVSREAFPCGGFGFARWKIESAASESSF